MNGLVMNQQGRRRMRQLPSPLGIKWSQLQNQTGTITWLKEDGIRVILSGVFLEEIRQVHAKTLNYAKLADIEQEEMEAPSKFLDRLREALHRFTEIDPKSEQGRVFLKDRFLSQLAADIHSKLLKQVHGPQTSLQIIYCNCLKQSIMVGNMRKRKQEKDKGTGRSSRNGCQNHA